MADRFTRFANIPATPAGLNPEIGSAFQSMLSRGGPNLDVPQSSVQEAQADGMQNAFTAAMRANMTSDINRAETAETPWTGQHDPMGDY